MNFTANDFTTSLPSGWQDRTMVTLIAPFEAGRFAANCVVTSHEIGGRESLEAFVLEERAMMEQSLPQFELLDFRADSLNGRPCCQQLHRFATENLLLEQVQTFILADRKIYVITGTATAEEFDAHIAAFREIVENFQIS